MSSEENPFGGLFGDPDELRRVALEQARITHHHPLSDAASLLVGELVQLACLGLSLRRLRAAADALVAAEPRFRFAPYRGLATGYVVDTLQTVLHFFFATRSFEECLVAVVNQGGDADTTAAIAGSRGEEVDQAGSREIPTTTAISGKYSRCSYAGRPGMVSAGTRKSSTQPMTSQRQRAVKRTSSQPRSSRRMLRSATRRLEQVAESADGADAHAGRLELGAQPRDVDLDRVVAELLVPTRQRLHEAVLQAAAVAETGDVVLLSPGGTSFDEFKDFEERGERFRTWVQELS